MTDSQSLTTHSARRERIEQRITAYLTTGGLFNPDLADHTAVRDLLIECREVLSAVRADALIEPPLVEV